MSNRSRSRNNNNKTQPPPIKKQKAVIKPVQKLNETLKACQEILHTLIDTDDAESFLQPVDWEALELLDYPKVITQPMDLGTVQTKFVDREYSDSEEFAADVRLVFENCMKFNRPDSGLYKTASKLYKAFNKQLQTIPSGSFTNVNSASIKSKPIQRKETSRSHHMNLVQLINQLPSENLEQVLEMIQKDSPEAITQDEDEEEIEIELSHIDETHLLQLNEFITKCINNTTTTTNKKQKIK